MSGTISYEQRYFDEKKLRIELEAKLNDALDRADSAETLFSAKDAEIQRLTSRLNEVLADRSAAREHLQRERDRADEAEARLDEARKLKDQWWALKAEDTCHEGEDGTAALHAIRGCAAQLGCVLAGTARVVELSAPEPEVASKSRLKRLAVQRGEDQALSSGTAPDADVAGSAEAARPSVVERQEHIGRAPGPRELGGAPGKLVEKTDG